MYLIYLALRKLIGYQLAYLTGYVISVVALYLLNSLFVFKSNSLSLSVFLKFSLIYVLQYILGAGLLELIVHFNFSETYAPILIIIILLPITFFLNRLVLSKA